MAYRTGCPQRGAREAQPDQVAQQYHSRDADQPQGQIAPSHPVEFDRQDDETEADCNATDGPDETDSASVDHAGSPLLRSAESACSRKPNTWSSPMTSSGVAKVPVAASAAAAS